MEKFTWRAAMVRAQRRYLRWLGRACDWNVSEMARMGGLNRTHLHRLLNQLQVSKPVSRRQNRGNQAWRELRQ